MTSRRWFSLFALPFLIIISSPRFAHETATMAPGVSVTPDGSTVSASAHATGWRATFFVQNTGTTTTTFTLACHATGNVACVSLDTPSLLLSPGSQADVEVEYSTLNSAFGFSRIKLSATGGGVSDTGHYKVTVGNSVVRIVSPGDDTVSSRIVVHSRQPLIRAHFLMASGYSTDTAATVLKWDNVAVSSLARHNRALLEWEVDSTRWLTVGASDSAKIEVQHSANGITTTETRWAVLLNDEKPVLGFTGMPLEALNGGFSSSFGPGFSIQGAEVETGISAVPYMSMGVPRSAGLVYSTRTSYPRALVQVDLDLPWPATTPDQVKLVLKRGGVGLDSLTLTNPTCTNSGVRCRATLQADLAAIDSFATPTRIWLGVLVRVTEGAAFRESYDSVEVVVVDRRKTQYGSGWWPSGISRLYATGNGYDRMLIGPSGSATIFRGNGDSVYISPPGSFTALVKTAAGWELRPRGSNARVRFDTYGRIIATADANGNKDSVTYTSTTDTVTSLIDPIGKTISFTYTSGRLSKMTTLTSGAARDLFVKIDATTNQLQSDSLPFTVSSATANRDVHRYLYQTYTGTKTVLITHAIGLILDTTRVVYASDSTFRNRPVQVFLPRVQDETGSNVTPDIEYYAYERQGAASLRALDSVGVYVELKDPRNNWTRSVLNRWAQARRTWDDLGLIGRTLYDPDGFVLWSEGRNTDSSRVYTVYDAMKRVVKSYIDRGAGGILRGDSMVYDANHRVIKRIDNRGKADSMGYDANGNVTYFGDKAGNVSRMAYLADGRLDSLIQGGNERTKFIYDIIWKQLSRVRNASMDTMVYQWYDQFGRDSISRSKTRVQVTADTSRWQWRETRSFLTLANQIDETVLLRTDNCNDPCNSPPSWPALTDTAKTQHIMIVRDRAGRDSLRRNDRLIPTMYVYDRMGRLTSRRPDSVFMSIKDSMIYDIAGNLRKTITRRGHTIESFYDSRNRDTSTTIPGVGNKKTVFDTAGRVVRMYYANNVDSIGGVNREVRWGYDKRGRLKADTSYTGSVARGTSYTYDSYERVSQTADPSGTWTTQFHADLGVPTTLITPFADTVVYGYDDHLRPTGPTVKSSGPQRTNTVGWNLTGRLDSLKHFVQSGTPWTPLSYYSGAADEPSWPSTTPHWVEQHGAGAALDTLRDSVQYDGWERVTSVVSFRNGVVVARDTFRFDRMGNVRTTSGMEVYDPVTNRLTYRINGTWTDSLIYDAAGNLDSLVSKKGAMTTRWGYDWDALNRLVTVRRNGTLIARYAYDVLGRRIAKRVYSSATGGAVAYTRFVYNGDHVAFEADSGGALGITLGRRYVWGMGVDDLIAIREQEGTVYYAVKDKLGSVRGLVKWDGTFQSSERFGPFGQLIEVSGSDLSLRYKWTGREYDVETGLYYFRARYYEPSSKRFISEDPVGYNGGTSLYAYVGGRLLDMRDPSGMLSSVPMMVGFRSFCTFAGSCLQADGSIQQAGAESYIDGINVGRGGHRSLPRNAMKNITITGNAAFDYVMGKCNRPDGCVSFHGGEATKAGNECKANPACASQLERANNGGHRVVVDGKRGQTGCERACPGATEPTAGGGFHIYVQPSQYGIWSSERSPALSEDGNPLLMNSPILLGHELSHVERNSMQLDGTWTEWEQSRFDRQTNDWAVYVENVVRSTYSNGGWRRRHN